MKVHNAALSFAPGTIHMAARLPDGAAAGASVADVEARHGKINYGGLKIGKGGEEAVAVTLDSLNLTGVSFFKLDVQGAERLALYGARETIRRSLPTVIYEVRRVHIGGKEGGGGVGGGGIVVGRPSVLVAAQGLFSGGTLVV